MNKLFGVIGVFLVILGVAYAQVVPQPGPPTPMACAYNTAPVTLTNGQAGWVQCDNAGQVKTTGGGGGGGSTTTTATAAAPALVEGSSSNPISVDLAANARTIEKNSTAILAAVQAAIPAGSANIGNVGQISQYPTGAIPYTATATGTTGATTATLTGAASVTTYLCGFSIRANATAAATGNATVTGVITATLNFTQWTAPLASGLGITEMIFQPCIPASTTNQSVAVVSAAPGSGGVVSVTMWGYKL